MRRTRGLAAITSALLVAAAGAVAGGAVAGRGVALGADDATDGATTGLSRDEVVALVLATDERFEGVADHVELEREARAEFDLGLLVSSDYVRILPTLTSEFGEPELFRLRDHGSWLVEVTLVAGCSPIEGTIGPFDDPCRWRHSWFHRVAPDGSVTLLFEEGDPLPVPSDA